jgi:hypothetical protein
MVFREVSREPADPFPGNFTVSNSGGKLLPAINMLFVHIDRIVFFSHHAAYGISNP